MAMRAADSKFPTQCFHRELMDILPLWGPFTEPS